MRSFMSSTLVLVLFLKLACSFEWEECPDEKSRLQKLTNVSLEPEPVPAGSAAKFEIQGKSGKAATFGLTRTRRR